MLPNTRRLAAAATGGLAAIGLLAAPAVADPSAGNSGKKDVVPVSVQLPGEVDCGEGEVLDLAVDGTIQVHEFTESRNIELSVFNLTLTFSNSDGDRWSAKDVGPDRLYLDDGGVFVAVSGRIGGAGFVGHFVFDTESEQFIFEAGRPLNLDATACSRLT